MRRFLAGLVVIVAFTLTGSAAPQSNVSNVLGAPAVYASSTAKKPVAATPKKPAKPKKPSTAKPKKTSSGKKPAAKPKATSTRTKRAAACSTCARDAHGRIKRSETAKQTFMRQTGYPKGRPGYVVDHIIPLACGGPDVPSNMQWQTTAQAKVKDGYERRNCR